jgi:hypothetical protein
MSILVADTHARMRTFFKDEKVKERRESPNIKTGRFLWMNEKSRMQYLAALQKKISEGYYCSENTLAKVVEELAPIFNENVNYDMSMHY